MKSIEFKPVALAVSLSMLFSAPAFAQQSGGAGAGAAQGAAVGGISTGAVAAAVAVVAAAAALSSGSSGAAPLTPDPGGDLAGSINDGLLAAAAGIGAGEEGLALFKDKFTAGSPEAVALASALDAFAKAENAQVDLATAKANFELAFANPASAAATVSALCGAPTCSDAQIVGFAFTAALKAKAASDALYYAIKVAGEFRALAADSGIDGLATLLTTFDGLIVTANAEAAKLQTVAIDAIKDYEALAETKGISGTTIAFPSGTGGTIGPSGTTL